MTLPSLIEQMLQPEFYPHSVIEPITLIQTHVSYVLLTGDYVYKVKKPVDFGFLNYSTLELRQHFCQEEIRLNQRGAQPLYIEILPITQQGDRYILNGNDPIVEYVLKMHQFPQENLFLERFKKGQLTEAELEQAGKVVAAYHQKCPTNDYIKKFGEIPSVRQAIDENYQQTFKYIGTVQNPQWYELTKAYTDNFFEKYSAVFTQRITSDKIKECHGDLHLRNICYWQDQILLFDCIEFNEPFRLVDVMYDIGFMVMDLEAEGAKTLANVFLNSYLEQTGDWLGLQVLPLYLSRQAYVRAKVTSFLLDDPNIEEADKQEAKIRANHYYKLAYDYTAEKTGKIILMSGLSGSGKTTVARLLARQKSAILIRSDALRKHLAQIPLNTTGSPEIYNSDMSEKTYSKLIELGLLLSKQGYTVILDAKFDKIEWREKVIVSSQKQKIPCMIIYCQAPDQVLKERLDARTQDISDATSDLLASQKAQAQPFTELEVSLVKIIDTTVDILPQLTF